MPRFRSCAGRPEVEHDRGVGVLRWRARVGWTWSGDSQVSKCNRIDRDGWPAQQCYRPSVGCPVKHLYHIVAWTYQAVIHLYHNLPANVRVRLILVYGVQ